MSHIALIPFGSAGDVLPFVWLGRQLKARGHRVTMIVSCVFQETAKAAGLEVIGLGQAEDFDRFISDPRIWQLYHGTKRVFEFAGESTGAFFEPIQQRHGTADQFHLLLAPCTVFGARLAREKLGIPLINVHLQPAVMISAHETPLLFPGMQHFRKLPLWLKRWIIHLPNPADRFAAPAVNQECVKHKVTPPKSLWWEWAHSPDGILCLFPTWFAQPQPDWPANRLQWDFPLEDLSSERPLQANLVQFLADGEKPIVFTPGSANIQAKRFFEVALQAVTQLGKRAVFVTRKLDQLPRHLPATILPVEYAPFSALLKQSCLFVHHGGIGTLAQGIAAAIPQLIMAMAHDQPDNAYRLEQLGIALRLSPRTFTIKKVTTALNQLLTNPTIQETCQTYAKHLSNHNSQEQLIDWIEERQLS
jgi:rhamnosyltransferase subunit B